MTDDGRPVAPETAERLFQLPATVRPMTTVCPAETMAAIESTVLADAQKEAEAESDKWLEEETVKLEAYAEDMERANELRAKELDIEVKAARKSLRGNQSLPLSEKIAEERRIKRLEEERDELKLSTFKRLREIRRDVESKLDDVAAQLAMTPQVTPLMTIRWELPA